MINNYKFYYDYDLIDDYKFPEDINEWLECPFCKSKPKIWKFDNGRSTGCKCHNSKYDHRSIVAESIMSVVNRCNGNTIEYNYNELKNNWNNFCKTRDEFTHQELVFWGRW